MPSFECPLCGTVRTVERNEDAPHRPFCSERCKMVDLGRWFDGTYSISEPMSPDGVDPESEELNESSV